MSKHLTDFSDRYPPMLVKELRQGLRAKTFVGVFLALQVFLAVMLFSASAASSSSSGNIGNIVSSIIFSFFGIAVLIIQPLRGTSALASEIKGNTIDMMVLTRLSARRIVIGKWFAIVSQSALLLSTIIPYLILRYFFGGMNLIAELVFLLLLFLTSMALTAFTVGLSGCTSAIVRGLIPVGGAIMGFILLVQIIFASIRFGSSSSPMEILSLDSPESRIAVAVYISIVTYLAMMMLSLGASLIAPAAENRSLGRRLLALALVSATVICSHFAGGEYEVYWLIIALISVPAIVIALVESLPLVATVCRPFVKRGPLGKAAGTFLYPTWDSGIRFAVAFGGLSLIAMAATTYLTDNPYNNIDEEEMIAVLALFGGLFFPALWQLFFFRGEGQRIGHYLLLLMGSFVLMFVLMVLAESMNSSTFLWFFVWNPLAFLPMMEEGSIDDKILVFTVALVDFLILGTLYIGSLIYSQKHSHAISEATQAEDPPAENA